MTRNQNGTPPAEEAVSTDVGLAEDDASAEFAADNGPVDTDEHDGPADAPVEEGVKIRARMGYIFDPSVEGVEPITDQGVILSAEVAEQVLNKDKSRVYINVVDTTSEDKE